MLMLFHQEEGEEKKKKKKSLSGKDKPEEYYGRAMNLTSLK